MKKEKKEEEVREVWMEEEGEVKMEKRRKEEREVRMKEKEGVGEGWRGDKNGEEGGGCNDG